MMTESDMPLRGFLDDCWQSTVVLYAKKPLLLCSGRVAGCPARCGARWLSWRCLSLPHATRAADPSASARPAQAQPPARLLITPSLPDGMPNQLTDMWDQGNNRFAWPHMLVWLVRSAPYRFCRFRPVPVALCNGFGGRERVAGVMPLTRGALASGPSCQYV